MPYGPHSPEAWIAFLAIVLFMAVVEVLISRAVVKAAEIERDEADCKYRERAGLVVSLDKELEEVRANHRSQKLEIHRLKMENRDQAQQFANLRGHFDESQAHNRLVIEQLGTAQGRILELEGRVDAQLRELEAKDRELEDKEVEFRKALSGRDTASARAMTYAKKVDELEGRVAEYQKAAVTFGRKTGKTQGTIDILEALDQSAILCDADEAQARQAAADRKEVVRLNGVVMELNGEIQRLKGEVNRLTNAVRNEAKLRTDAQAIHDAKERDFQANTADMRAALKRQAQRLAEAGDTVSQASVRAELLRLTTARDEAQAKADRLRTELEGIGEHTKWIVKERDSAREGCKKLKAKSEDLAKQIEEGNRLLFIANNRLEVIDKVARFGYREEAQAPAVPQPGQTRTYTFGPAPTPGQAMPRHYICGNGPLIDGEKT